MTTHHVHDNDTHALFWRIGNHDSFIDAGFRTAAREAKKRYMMVASADQISSVEFEGYYMAISDLGMIEPMGMGVEVTPWLPLLPQANISDALFGGLEADAIDAENSIPPREVVDEAKRIVQRLNQNLLDDCDVYTLEEGKVAIEVFGLPGHGFLLICEPGGSALCIVTHRGVSRRARYESSATLPDGFLHEGLADARRGS